MPRCHQSLPLPSLTRIAPGWQPEEKRQLPTVTWQIKLQVEARERPQETPQGYVTNSGQHEQLSPSADIEMAAGREGNISPTLPTHRLLLDSCSPTLSPVQNQPLSPSPGGTTRRAPSALPRPTAGGPQASVHQAYKVILPTQALQWTCIYVDHTWIHNLTFIRATLSSYRFLKASGAFKKS